MAKVGGGAALLLIVGALALVACSRTEPVEPPEPAGAYQANWESLAQHESPAWFNDAKLGIFIHWGVYSVPGLGARRRASTAS